MGRLKALLPAGPNDSFLTRILRTFAEAGVARQVVVLGYQADRLQNHLTDAGLTPEVAVNRRFEAGQLSSLLLGLEVADRPDTEAVLLMLVDAPFVAASTVRSVIDRYQATRVPIVRPIRGEAHGHPVLIDRSLFPLLRAADPSTGAKPVVRGHVSPSGDVAVDDPGAFMDIDTPEEYARARKELPSF
jgi:molybdenum cofactor cytidylyltransferase